ncbi:MAG TPA: hypothetical protein VNJ01_07730 [Bacteriovoracaceae bacterium]|nr:hypothetical protein [Bacteriovoracaceae bacterium]
MMLKTFSFLFLFFFFAVTENALAIKLPSDLAARFSASSGVPVEAQTFDVNARMINFSREQEEKVLSAVELIKKVVASEEFRDGVINKTYKGVRAFVDNGGLSNEEVYQRILHGAETLGGGGRNNTMDLELELYFERQNTIGYTFPNIVRIFMNKKYFNKFKPHQIADNMFHEWLHKLGFKHAVASTKGRRHSVPYSIGYLVKKLAKKYTQI